MTNLEILMLREEIREVESLMSAPLRHQYHTSNLLHLWIVRRTDTIQIARYLRGMGEGGGERGGQQYTRLHMEHNSTWVRRSDMMMNFLSTFLGRMYVNPASLISSEET